MLFSFFAFWHDRAESATENERGKMEMHVR